MSRHLIKGMKLRKPLLPVIFLSLLFMTACSGATNISSVSATDPAEPVSSAVPAHSTVPGDGLATATKSALMAESLASPFPSATTGVPAATVVPTLLSPDLSVQAADIYLYPIPEIFAGDQVTFQLLPFVPENVAAAEVSIRILVDGAEIANGTLAGRSHLSGEAVGLFEWAWDTTGMVGVHQIRINLDWQDAIWTGDENPDNNEVLLDATVLDPQTQPPGSADAIWKMAESDCCRVHVVSGTAADRDLPQLLEAVDVAVQQAVDKLSEPAQQRIDVYLIDRIIGQGGYAGSGMVVSYLDRDYASNKLHQVMVHETVHLLDRQFAPQRIAFFAEGLAVWASGGHYRPEDLNLAAAALLETGQYVPMRQLIDRFYPVQHETGYLEAAGIVTYLIENFGWSRFRAFYSDVIPSERETLAEAVDVNLREHYGMSLEQLESEWVSFLESLPLNRSDVLGLQTTIRYYNTMRLYQLRYDPTAHFMKAWLPSPGSVQEKGNPADLSGHPESQLTVTLEVMLQAAGGAMWVGDYNRANVLLGSIERVIASQGQFIDPFAMSYWAIVDAISRMGYEVHQINLRGDEARAVVSPAGSVVLDELNLILDAQEWILSN